MNMNMKMFSLDGRLALVTGGSRGIGLSAAMALARSGANIVLAARDGATLDAAAGECRSSGRSIATCPVDIRDARAIPAWYDSLVATLGRPDILVNSAGTTRRAPATELSLEQWDEVLAVNLTGVFAMCQAFARHCMAAKAMGKIINIASLATSAARKDTAAYTASKGGVGQLTKALAVDWAASGILVNALAPGYIATKLTEPLVNDPAFDSWVRQRCPLGRWGTPEDIAWPVVFLASPASDFITGQILYVDGGWLATF